MDLESLRSWLIASLTLSETYTECSHCGFHEIIPLPELNWCRSRFPWPLRANLYAQICTLRLFFCAATTYVKDSIIFLSLCNSWNANIKTDNFKSSLLGPSAPRLRCRDNGADRRPRNYPTIALSDLRNATVVQGPSSAFWDPKWAEGGPHFTLNVMIHESKYILSYHPNFCS